MLPGIIFALRFSNELEGFFAKQRDRVARELQGVARCLFAFQELVNDPVWSPQYGVEVQADFYNLTPENRARIKQIIQDNQVVLVVFEAGFYDLSANDLRFLRKLGVKTINTENNSYKHESSQSIFTAILKLLVRRVLKFRIHNLHIANSKGQYDFLLRHMFLPPHRLSLVAHGIDCEYYHPGDRNTACTRLGLDPNTIWIMAAALSRPEKRIDLLIEAVRRVKQARPLAHIGFFYVGDGWMLARWQERARSLLPTTDCRFFGWQSDMRPFYHAASIFIHGASRESFGLVLAEAMASGLPVIATRAHGPAEIIAQGRTGYLIEQNDWDGFVGAILGYIDDPELGRSHGAMGRLRCLEHYTIDRETIELTDLIRPFLGVPRRQQWEHSTLNTCSTPSP